MIKYYFIRILRKLKLLKYFNFELTKDGIIFPIIGAFVESVPQSELWMTDLLKKLLINSSGCFVDVGVNIGQTLIKVKQIKNDCTYIGFEPNPFCVFYVQKLININNLKNTIIIPAGISNEAGVLDLDFYSESLIDSSASIMQGFRPGKLHHTQKVVLINSKQIEFDLKISILKIDVEGAEYFVLKEFKDKIKTDRPLILIEILPIYSTDNIDRLNRQNAIRELIKELNYKILRIEKNREDRLKGLNSIDDIGIHSNLNHCDYLLVPIENLENILGLF